MFTGIVEAIGKVVKYDGETLGIRAPFHHVRRGESISVDGACLTVTRQNGSILFFDVGPETRRVTTLKNLRPESHVNLERALRVGDRLGGHYVLGHVEATGVIRKVERSGRNRWIYIQLPRELARYVRAKGSLAVDGISLTIVKVAREIAKIMLVPHTLSQTTLGDKGPGDRVNLEPDLLAKYVLR
jgi:riboflavin synthase